MYFFDETDGVFAAPLTFPLVSIQFRHTLRVCREVSLTVSDNQAVALGVHPLSHTTCGLDLLLLSMLGSAICAWHVCCIRALFGAHVQTIVSHVPIAFGNEHRHIHVSKEKGRSTSLHRQQTCALLKSSITFLPSVSPP